jgi:fibronectin-binding autotransporter adhesin
VGGEVLTAPYGNGGNGGDGGAGIGLSDGASVVNQGTGTAIGGGGGVGGAAIAAMGGNGGNGGAGILGGDGVVIINQDTATVLGGAGNSGSEPANFRPVLNGRGGYGIFVGAGAHITNRDNGSITGGGGASQAGSDFVGGSGGAGIGTGDAVIIINQDAATITGGAGAAAGTNNGAGEGGAGVIASGLLDNSGTISGGAGGAGDNAPAGTGGVGVSGSALTILNGGAIAGGNGGAPFLGLNAAGGGAGIDGANLAIINTGTISGGDGGGGFPTSPDGGAGISGSDLTVVNAGTISGGVGGLAGTPSAAIDFTGGVNRLELRTGYIFNGAIVANGVLDTLALGGTNDDDTFDATQLLAGQRFQNFEQFEKLGSGTWTLEGDGSAFTGQTNVAAGTLLVGATSGSAALGGTLDVLSGGTLGGFGTVGTTTLRSGGVIAPGGSIGKLTVNGDFIGQGGIIEIETVLGDDSSSTDLLVVTGDTSGSADVRVTNRGGAGAATNEGIKIIDVGGVSGASFTLLGDYVLAGEQAVVIGAYGYTLHQNGISTPTDGDWYLRSQLIGSIDPTDPVYQPGAPIYETYGSVLQGLNGVSTLQQRVGGGAVDGNGIRTRIEGSHSLLEPSVSTTGSSYELNTYKLETGIEGKLFEGDAGRLVGGLTAHYGQASADISSPFGVGSISTQGYGLGGTLTWYGVNGFYVDGQAKANWYDSSLTSRTLGTALVDGNNGFGYTVSAETGQVIALNENWSLTPQAQLVYSSVDFDSFTDPFGTDVSLGSSESLKGRLGLAANYQNEWQDDAGKTSRTNLYGAVNLYHEFLDGTSTEVAGVNFASEDDRSWGGLGIGGSYSWNDDQYSLNGEVSVNTGLTNFASSYSLNATAGFKVRF